MKTEEVAGMTSIQTEKHRDSQPSFDPILDAHQRQAGERLAHVVVPALVKLKNRLEANLDYHVKITEVPAHENLGEGLSRRVDCLITETRMYDRVSASHPSDYERNESRIVFITGVTPGTLSLSVAINGKKFNGQPYPCCEVDEPLIEAWIFKLVNVFSPGSSHDRFSAITDHRDDRED